MFSVESVIYPTAIFISPPPLLFPNPSRSNNQHLHFPLDICDILLQFLQVFLGTSRVFTPPHIILRSTISASNLSLNSSLVYVKYVTPHLSGRIFHHWNSCNHSKYHLSPPLDPIMFTLSTTVLMYSSSWIGFTNKIYSYQPTLFPLSIMGDIVVRTSSQYSHLAPTRPSLV